MNQVEKPQLGLLCELGMMGASFGFEALAHQLFFNLQKLVPDNPAPTVGLAFNSLLQGKHRDVLSYVHILEQCKDGLTEEARLIKAVSLIFLKKSDEAHKLLEQFTPTTDLSKQLLKQINDWSLSI
jgi:hypothetical protein